MRSLPIGVWGSSPGIPPLTRSLLIDTNNQRGQLESAESSVAGWEAVTVDCWFRAANITGGNQTLAGRMGSNLGSGFRLRLAASELAFDVVPAGGSVATRSTAPPSAFAADQWYHVAGSWLNDTGGGDSGRAALYQNGSRFDIVAGAAWFGAALEDDPGVRFAIGRNGAGDGTIWNQFFGNLALVRVWRRELPEAEIAEVFNKVLPPDYPDLEFQYSFPKGSLAGLDPNEFELQLEPTPDPPSLVAQVPPGF